MLVLGELFGVLGLLSGLLCCLNVHPLGKSVCRLGCRLDCRSCRNCLSVWAGQVIKSFICLCLAPQAGLLLLPPNLLDRIDVGLGPLGHRNVHVGDGALL